MNPSKTTRNQCPFCHAVFANRATVLGHASKKRCAAARKATDEEKKKILSKFYAAESKKEFACCVCKQVFSAKWLLNRHKKDAPRCKEPQKRHPSFLDDFLGPPIKQKLSFVQDSEAPRTRIEDTAMLSEASTTIVNSCEITASMLGNMRYSWKIIDPPTKGALRNCIDIPKLIHRRRNVSFFCVVADCDIPKFKLERAGLDEYVKSKKKRGSVLSTEVSRFRTKLTALVPEKGEMQIHVFMNDLSKLPPAFQGSDDGLAIFAVFGGRKASARSGKGHRWSVNDSGGWLMFSLAGEIICGAGTCYDYSAELKKFLRRLVLPTGTLSLSRDSIKPACTTEECESWVNYSVNDAQKELAERLAQATDDQRKIYMALTKEIDSRAGSYRVPETSSLHMILGGAGSGKTSLLRLLLAYVKAKCIPVLPVASTKMAATLLSGGRTVHSAFGIRWRRKERRTMKGKEEKKEKKSPEEKGDEPKCKTTPVMAGAVAGLRVLIWDEISCSSKLVVDAVSKEFQLYHNNTLPFGGVVTIFCGDFYQLLPVVEEGQDDRKIALPEWAYWDCIQKHQLTVNLRAADPIYVKVLEAQKSTKEIVLPQQIMVERTEELIDFVFPRFKQDYLSKGFFTGRVILCPCRWQVREINACMMNDLPGEKEVLAEVTVKPKPPPPSKNPTENVLAPSSAPPMPGKVIRLYAKTGCLLLCTKNISDKIYNGTRLVYLRRKGDAAVFRVINGDTEEEVTLAKSQLVWHGCIPFTLGFALTIHKAQGQTLRTVGLDLRSKFFSHGQATVAFSRARHLEDIRVLSNSNIIANPIYLDWLEKIYSPLKRSTCPLMQSSKANLIIC